MSRSSASRFPKSHIWFEGGRWQWTPGTRYNGRGDWLAPEHIWCAMHNLPTIWATDEVVEQLRGPELHNILKP